MFNWIKNFTFLKNIFFLKIKSFSLLEMSFVIAIMGIIVGLYLPNFLNIKNSHKRQITNKHMEQIFTALSNYLVQNKKLPCPVQNINSVSPIPPCPSNKGFIPYKTIGIEKKSILNGYNKPIKYIINLSLSKIVISENNVLKVKQECLTQNKISISDESGLQVIDQNENNLLAVLLLSEEEILSNQAKSNAEIININSSNNFYKLKYSNNPTNYFRHHIRYCTLGMLYNYYGKHISPRIETSIPNRSGIQNGCPIAGFK